MKNPVTQQIEVIMPKMGESVNEGTLLEWVCKEGDEVKEDETIAEVTTAKVNVDIQAPSDGVIAKILVPEGDTVPVDTVLAVIAPPGVSVEDVDLSGIETAPEQTENSSDEEKVSPQPNGTGNVHRNAAKVAPKAPEVSPEPADTIQDEREVERIELKKSKSSPVVRRIAKQMNVDLDQITGTGAHGRVTRKDLENWLANNKKDQQPLKKEVGADFPSGDTTEDSQDVIDLLPPEIVNVTHLRRQIAEQMVSSVNNIPQAFTLHEVDFTQLEKMRIRQKHVFEKTYGAKLTPLMFLVKAISDALLQCPYINASWGDGKIVLHRNVNIGVAVAIEGGLVVPVLKCVENMDLPTLSRKLAKLAQKARDGALTPEDMSHTTFTITSPGQLGAVAGIPIVNKPQGGILHLGAIRKVPAVVTGPDGEDTIGIRHKAVLTLGIDHRLIDGWEADKFMVLVKERIERTDFHLAI